MAHDRPLHLAVALDGAGWHPAAWREPAARPDALFTASYWADLVRTAEAGMLDFVTIEDALGVQTDDPARVQGRLDAVQIAARVGPVTSHIGLVPTATVTHTEPFHISKAIATLDFVTGGRAGWRAQVSRPAESAHFGRRSPVPSALLDEAGDFVEVVRRLWDSWEDDAEIRDTATGRFIDREKLHYIDFAGDYFSVRGPSITPRPPQGQPLVTALAHGPIPYEFAVRCVDVVYVTPSDVAGVRRILPLVAGVPHVFADLVVEFGGSGGFDSDATIFTGSVPELADLLLAWQAAGLSGFRLRPARLPRDLEEITGSLVPLLRRRGVFRSSYAETSLRSRLGLPRPANRFARAEGAPVA